jgi:hypothetical protein
VQAASFEREGHRVLPGLLAGSQLRDAHDQVAALLRRPVPDGCARPHNTLVPLRWDDVLVLGALRSPRLIGAVAAAVGAVDLRWISGYVSVKEPQSPPLWWHQDWWCWSHPASFAPRAPQVAVLCYLDRTDERSGALRLLPGSHRRSVALHAALPAAHAQGEVGLEHAAMRDDPDQLTFAAEPGDAIAIDYRLLHGTHPNEVPARRCCLILNFAPAWGELAEDIRAHLVRHPAQPSARDDTPADLRGILPAFAGEPRDLTLARDAPARFEIA